MSEARPGPHVVGQRDSLIAEVFRRYGGRYLARHRVTREQRLAILNIARCRTEAMGGHRRKCPHCGYVELHYDSCRDRNCPTCQWMDRATWTVKHAKRMLPVPSFMVTFTVPSEVSRIARQNQKRVFALMLRASNRALQDLASASGLGRLGVTAVLHTWSRTMQWHPHPHLIVTGGGFDGKNWNPTKKPNYLFSTRRIGALYRKHLLQGLHQLYDAGELELAGDLSALIDPIRFGALMTKLWSTKFIVNVQPPRGKPEHAVKYLATYTRGVAISDYRMLSLEDGQVTFRTRGDKTLTLGWEEFIGRFLLHVLPSGFKKVRHYGPYSNSSSKQLEMARQAILATQNRPAPEPEPEAAVLEAKTWEERVAILTGVDPRICPRCKRAGMVMTELRPRSRASSSPEDSS